MTFQERVNIKTPGPSNDFAAPTRCRQSQDRILPDHVALEFGDGGKDVIDELLVCNVIKRTIDIIKPIRLALAQTDNSFSRV